MKNILQLSLVLLSTTFFTACSMTQYKSDDAKFANYTHVTRSHTIKETHDLIMQSGKENGWRMTAFKANSIIAEKTEGDETTSATINFTDEYFDVTPPNSELQDIIAKALSK